MLHPHVLTPGAPPPPRNTRVQGNALSDTDIEAVVTCLYAAGRMGAFDSDNLPLLLSSKDVTATSGLCSQYCGWHTTSSYTNGAVMRCVGRRASCVW